MSETRARRLAGVPHRAPARKWPMTVLGVVFLAIMVFPVYWMINSSLQSNSGAATTQWLPFLLTFAGYRAAITQQGQNLATSLIVAVSAVILTFSRSPRTSVVSPVPRRCSSPVATLAA